MGKGTVKNKKNKQPKIKAKTDILKIHVGCKEEYLDGWVNIDDRVLKADLNLDTLKPLPFKENSVDIIYDRIFIYRLRQSDEEIKDILKNFYSILKPTGLLRIELPDLRHEKKLKPWLINLGFQNIEFTLGKALTKDTALNATETEVIKLHIGCGKNYFEGWVNIDNNSDNNIEKLDLNFDLRNSLPFEENSVDIIYNEHFLEHLTVEEGLRALVDFNRVLKPDGILRIAMPDLEDAVALYNNPNWREENKASMDKFGLGFIQTKAEYLNINMRWWGHKWLYDWEELERRLKEAGFQKIKKCQWRESENPELNNLETRSESTLIAEASLPKSLDKPLTVITNKT